MPGNNFSMIVLAGGKSRRMGTPKVDLRWRGQTFLELQLQKGAKLGIKDLLVSGYQGTLDGFQITQDRFPDKGPLGGLETCLRKAQNNKCLVLSVDVPLVPVSELSKLMEASISNDSPITILKSGEKEQPLIAVYDRDLADGMLQEITQHNGSVFAFINRTGYCVYESDAPEHFFANVNFPEEYQSILQYNPQFFEDI